MNRRKFFLLLAALGLPGSKKKVEAVPSGFIVQWHGAQAPRGWVIVDHGTSHSPTYIQKL